MIMIRKAMIIFLLLLVAQASGQIEINLEKQISISTSKVEVVKICSELGLLTCGGNDGLITVYQFPEMNVLHQLRYHKKEITCLLYDPEHDYLISGSKDKKIAMWDLKSGTMVLEIKDFKGKPGCLALSPNNRKLAVCGEKKEIYLWEYPLGKFMTKLEGHDKDVIFLDFNQSGSQLLSVGEDKTCIIWDMNNQKPSRKIEIDPHIYENSGIGILSAASSPDKNFFAVGMEERVLKKGSSGMGGVSNLSAKHDMMFERHIAFYNWKTGAEIEILQAPGRNLDYLAITPDKSYVVIDNSTLKRNKLAVMDIERGIVELNYAMDGEVSTIDISIDGKWMVAGYTVDKDNYESYMNLWSLEGVEAYFADSEGVVDSSSSPFGATFRVTTSDQPLLDTKEPNRVAVLYFDGAGVSPGLPKGVTYSIEAQLSNSPSVTLIERNRINAVLDELKLQASGLTARQAAEVGNLLDAEYVLIGIVSKKGNSMSMVAKLVDVETSEIIGIREVQGEDATEGDFDKMISILGPTLAKMSK
jgi:WD40 repeat protein